MADLYMRTLGMMQMLAAADTEGETPEGPERGIITREAASEAILQLFAVIDEYLQDGFINQERALHAMCMLMAVREYVIPLPDPQGDEELLANDLREIRRLLEQGRAIANQL